MVPDIALLSDRYDNTGRSAAKHVAWIKLIMNITVRPIAENIAEEESGMALDSLCFLIEQVHPISDKPITVSTLH